MEKRIRAKQLALAALAGAVIVIPLSASATLLYDPVVTVIGNGTTTLSSASFPVSIDLFDNSVTAQASPVSSATYNNTGAAGTRLVDSGSASPDGMIANNPSLVNAAAQGLSYTGPAYVYSPGYDDPVGTASIVSSAATRVVGSVTLTATSVGNPTILATSTSEYVANNIRCAVGGDNDGATTPLYTAGTGTPSSTTVGETSTTPPARARSFTTGSPIPGPWKRSAATCSARLARALRSAFT